MHRARPAHPVVGIRLIPDSVLVDRAGNLRFYFVNERDWSAPEAIACVRSLAGDHPASLAAEPQALPVPPPCDPGPAATGS